MQKIFAKEEYRLGTCRPGMKIGLILNVHGLYQIWTSFIDSPTKKLNDGKL